MNEPIDYPMLNHFYNYSYEKISLSLKIGAHGFI